MDKPVHNNGYTLMEMLVVLLIVTLFSIPVSLQKNHLTLFMKKMKMYSIAVQCNAFQLKEVKTLSLMINYFIIQIRYPAAVSPSIIMRMEIFHRHYRIHVKIPAIR